MNQNNSTGFSMAEFGNQVLSSSHRSGIFSPSFVDSPSYGTDLKNKISVITQEAGITLSADERWRYKETDKILWLKSHDEHTIYLFKFECDKVVVV